MHQKSDFSRWRGGQILPGCLFRQRDMIKQRLLQLSVKFHVSESIMKHVRSIQKFFEKMHQKSDFFRWRGGQILPGCLFRQLDIMKQVLLQLAITFRVSESIMKHVRSI